MEANTLVQWLDGREWDIFSQEMLSDELDGQAVQNQLETLVSRGLLRRIERGKYCRHNFRDEHVISNYLALDGVVAYWSALNLHGLTEQIPNTIFVQTTKQKKHKTVFGVRYRFIKVKPSKMVGIETQGYGNHAYRCTDVEKTLLDCFDLPQYSGGYEELIRAVDTVELDADKLTTYCRAVGNLSATKRLAYLLELFEKPHIDGFLDFAQSQLNEKYSPFDPFGEDEGVFDSRWRLRLNIPREDLLDMTQKAY